MTRADLPRNLATARQVAAIATAFALPLSTSAQAITVAIFAILALLTLDRSRFNATLRRPAAWLPVALFALIAAGTLWSMQPFGAAVKWIAPYSKLLLIPLLLATAFTPRQTLQVGFGFLAACTILLALSWASFLWPSGPWGWFKLPGVPVKDNAVQSGCFALCAFALAIGAVRTWPQDRRRAAAIAVLALLFLADIFLIYVSKTGAIMAAALLGLFLLHVEGWRRVMLIALPAMVVIAVALWVSAPAQRKLAEISGDINAGSGGQETVSTGARLDFWNKAKGFVMDAPLLGHGTGSIKPLYQSLEATRPSPYGEATPDPHNQFLHVVLQVGLVGGALLLAMWLAHARLFTGRDMASIIGQAVVLQNVIGSLFNSHLSAVTQGMLYCLAVGLLGAMVRSVRTDAAGVGARPLPTPDSASASGSAA
ncbi:MAG: O-antigen ligase family protein [Tardiphaga sp.]